MTATTAATFCATLVDEWVRAGITDAVGAPGSRTTPMALALATRAEVRLHVHHDERSAAFVALGIGKASGRPAVLQCSSGTAAANFHPAVIEAHQAEVPMLVCTADRPPELRDVAAPQTIDQSGLYTTAVRWFHDPGVPDDARRSSWRSLAARAFAATRGNRPGPVHLNLSFRDPLVGDAGPMPDGRPDGRPWSVASVSQGAHLDDAVVALLDEQRGIIVAGAGSGEPAAVLNLAERAGWPVLSDPPSGCRVPHTHTVAAADALLRHDAFAADHTPTVVLRLGRPPASKVLAQWLAGSGARTVQVAMSDAWIDPDGLNDATVVAEPSSFCTALGERLRGGQGTPWLARWRRAESRAQAAIDGWIDAQPFITEPFVARATLAALADGSSLVVSSSMPVRDLEWYGAPRHGVTVFANRGANGIDGVTSTAVGVALATGAPTSLLIGDVAFLHDSNGLLGAVRRDVDLTVIVVDNDGGGIFSFLPQAQVLPVDRFEQLFGTPHGVDIEGLARAHGIAAETIESPDAFRKALSADHAGVRVLRVVTDRVANVGVHDEVHRAVRAAL
jgi:2-succinyl-5-enolpyruvyl-6-hydroxy-3-cyclohexene-1-carboxylate synthase